MDLDAELPRLDRQGDQFDGAVLVDRQFVQPPIDGPGAFVVAARVVGLDEFQARRQIGHQLDLLGRGRAGIGNRQLVGCLALQVTAFRTGQGHVQLRRDDLEVEAVLGAEVGVGPGGNHIGDRARLNGLQAKLQLAAFARLQVADGIFQFAAAGMFQSGGDVLGQHHAGGHAAAGIRYGEREQRIVAHEHAVGAVVSTTSFGRVTIDRAVASAWKRTVATLPTSPSSVGMICISTDVPPPGLSVPNDQTSSPRGPCDAGGAVPSRRVPRGT